MSLTTSKIITESEKRLQESSTWFWEQATAMLPKKLPPILDWGEQNVRLFGGTNKHFDRHHTPWTQLPIQLADQIGRIRFITFIKPVQTGGSTAGEIAIARWILRGYGRVQYCWDSDEFAKDRWDSQVEPTLRSCKPIRDIWPDSGTQRNRSRNCFVVFPNITLDMMGVFSENSLDSDSVPFQVIEEAHKYEQGKLGKAFRRGTACAFPITFIISNASTENDDLHRKFKAGTQQHWEVLCPGCGKYHIMRTRWEDSRPDLGGLRYDASAGKMADASQLNYNKISPTVRYQMPCGHIVANDPQTRRALSATGRYSMPFNEGALPNDVSLTYQAVACHNIPWITLIQEKHDALRALRTGDPKPWKKYLQERECQFYSTETHPFQGEMIVTSGVVKNREGLKDRATILWKADWQAGYKSLGQLEHFWLVIEHVMANCNSMIVWEGKCHSENELIAVLEQHNAIERGAGVIDCSFNTKHLLQFCYRNRFNAIMSNESWHGGFLHRADRVRRYYDEGSAICGKLNVNPVFPAIPTKDGWSPAPKEPLVINVNKAGMIANHFFIREHKPRTIEDFKNRGLEAKPEHYIERIIPQDVSEEFRMQYDSWIRVGKDAKKRQDEVSIGGERFQQIRPADHMLICLAGIDMLKDWSGLLGHRLTELRRIAQPEGENI